jgi:hypothetical protein
MRDRIVAAVESLSWRSCYLVTGLRISWCGLAHWAGRRRLCRVLDRLFHCREVDHTRRSFERWY